MKKKHSTSYANMGLRTPQRRRGIERFDAILDVAQTILSRDDVMEIRLADVASEGGIPLPSLYHFFANRNALLVALAQRHLARLEKIGTAPLAERPATWQVFMRQRMRNGVTYLNANPDALRLFMGAGVSAEVRLMDLHGNVRIAEQRARQLRELFDCSSLSELEKWLAYATAMADGVWSGSWSLTRTITDEAVEEGTMAVIAYLRLSLPERLSPRISNLQSAT